MISEDNSNRWARDNRREIRFSQFSGKEESANAINTNSMNGIQARKGERKKSIVLRRSPNIQSKDKEKIEKEIIEILKECNCPPEKALDSVRKLRNIVSDRLY